MPSSTRRQRVNDSDDEAEAALPSQTRPKGSAAAGPSQPRAAASPSANGSGETDTGDDLRPQPLSREHLPNVRNLIADLKTQDLILEKCIKALNDTAEQVAEAYRMHDDCPQLVQAEADLRELIDAQAEKAVRRKVLEEIMQDLQGGVRIEDPAKLYKDEVQSKMDAYSKQTSRKKYAKNTDYHNFKNAVWVMSQEGAMPPVRDLIPAEEGDEQDDSDDEILQGGVTQNFRCPLTTNILEDPLTNTNCRHSYTGSAITNYVASGNNRCPAAGCVATVTQRSLKKDPDLAKKVAAFKRREEERLIARRQASTILY